MTETSNSLPEGALQLLRSYAQGGTCVCDLAISTLNRLELALENSGVNFSTPGFHPGVLTRQYSRDSVLHFPDINVRFVRYPQFFRREILGAGDSPDSQLRMKYLDRVRALVSTDNLYAATDASIRKAHLTLLREFLGDDGERIKNGYVKRLIDRPEVNQQLVRFHIEHQTEKLTALLRGSDYEFGKQRLDFRRNSAQHHQRATIGSYICRAFAPDELPAIKLKKGRHGSTDAREELIHELPIDPQKISDELIVNLGLAPEKFSHYIPGAKNRYKLAIRQKFLNLFAQARPVQRSEELSPTSARILTLPHAKQGERIAIFRTVTDSHIHTTGIKKPRKRFHKVSRVLCSVFESPEEAIRSQEHAIESLRDKMDDYLFLWDTFEHYAELTDEFRDHLLSEARDLFGRQKSFYDSKLTHLLQRLSEHPNNALIIQLITRTLGAAFADTDGKQKELQKVKDILSNKK